MHYTDGLFGMTSGTLYLGMRFPAKWIQNQGRTLWAVFSCYDNDRADPDSRCGAGNKYHDRFNLMKMTLTVP